jgi:hypothetical protein
MGTFSGYNSRNDVVSDLVNQYTSDRFKIIDRKATNFGRHLWMLIKPKEGNSFICLFKLSSHRGDWGYKPIDESMGPCHWDCPITLIQQADPPTTQYATDWRNQVYKYAGCWYIWTMQDGA